MPTKKQWLEAVKKKIADYKKDWRSYGSIYFCSFCRVCNNHCDACIIAHKEYIVPCLYMRTYPQGKEEHTDNRIEFWERAYEILAKLPASRFTRMKKKVAFPELWSLDATMPKNKPHFYIPEPIKWEKKTPH